VLDAPLTVFDLAEDKRFQERRALLLSGEIPA
jgi:hypothetical protein